MQKVDDSTGAYDGLEVKETKEVEEKDDRIERAAAVTAILNTRGYKILVEEWERIMGNALSELTNESLSDKELKENQKEYNLIRTWMKIPQFIIEDGKDAMEESQTDAEAEERIKSTVPYLGRRY